MTELRALLTPEGLALLDALGPIDSTGRRRRCRVAAARGGPLPRPRLGRGGPGASAREGRREVRRVRRTDALHPRGAGAGDATRRGRPARAADAAGGRDARRRPRMRHRRRRPRLRRRRPRGDRRRRRRGDRRDRGLQPGAVRRDRAAQHRRRGLPVHRRGSRRRPFDPHALSRHRVRRCLEPRGAWARLGEPGGVDGPRPPHVRSQRDPPRVRRRLLPLPRLGVRRRRPRADGHQARPRARPRRPAGRCRGAVGQRRRQRGGARCCGRARSRARACAGRPS